MDGNELEHARAQVAEYFSGRDVTVNTVLAAYLRAAGLPASGDPWLAAKSAMSVGATFAEAVAFAGGKAGETSTTTTSAQEAENFLDQIVEDDPSHDAEVPSYADPPRYPADAPRTGQPSLTWFAKQYGPGDMDGVGTKKLLGTPDLARTEILVRETAQNSWDARGTASSIDFVMNLRRLDDDTITALRDQIFTGSARQLGLDQLFASSEVWVLEVVDRGTTGLQGPIRNDLAVDKDSPTNFIDLVFNVGAPKDFKMGGGTYGFGKSIAYSISRVGTTLIWSRCKTANGLEDRLIGSAIGEGFERGGLRFTGRHWWGNVIDGEDRVEPALGEAACELAESVFHRHFPVYSTGTSMLILDPLLGEPGDSPEQRVQALAKATRKHLWPKLLAPRDGGSLMNIKIQLDGEDVEIIDRDSESTFDHFSACLQAVRDTQGTASSEVEPPMDLVEIRHGTQNVTLGHLAVTRFPVRAKSPEQTPTGEENQFDGELLSNRVALMRHDAELVVKYIDLPSIPIEGIDWVGVFKPTADKDSAFAASEPPAHDNWNPDSLLDKRAKSQVRVALRKIPEAISDFLSPLKQAASSAEIPPAAMVAAQLSDLMLGLPGTGPSRKQKKSRATTPQAPRTRAKIHSLTTEVGRSPGWNVTEVEVSLENPREIVTTVNVVTELGVEGGAVRDEGDLAHTLRRFGWITSNGTLVDGPYQLGQNETATFVFESRDDVAVDLDVEVVEV